MTESIKHGDIIRSDLLWRDTYARELYLGGVLCAEAALAMDELALRDARRNSIAGPPRQSRHHPSLSLVGVMVLPDATSRRNMFEMKP